MNMLGRCDSAIGAQDYFNIEGAVEFSSDYTKIVLEVGGFDTFVDFIESDETRKLKAAVIATGALIRKDRKNEKLLAQRQKQLKEFRERYYALGQKKTDSVKKFLSTVNKEIVSAKAMFLAYSDPFEKYRALLFEYAHTLGHGVEAYANLCYTNAIEKNVPVPEEAQRLHGQCVGMAVLMAGQVRCACAKRARRRAKAALRLVRSGRSGRVRQQLPSLAPVERQQATPTTDANNRLSRGAPATAFFCARFAGAARTAHLL